MDNFETQNLDDSYVDERVERLSDKSNSSLLSSTEDLFKITVDLDDDDDDDGDATTLRSSLPLWHLLPEDHGIMTITENHRVYPNFPHVYNWDNEIFAREHLVDFTEIMYKTIYNERCVNHYFVLYCLRIFYSRAKSNGESIRDSSSVVSRAFACFLLGYLKKLNCDTTYKYSIALPGDLLKPVWIEIFESIKIEDFISDIVPVMLDMPILQNKCRRLVRQVKDATFHAALNNSFTLVSLTIQWLFRELNDITPKIMYDLVDIFKNFAVLGNFIMALPFSLFTPAPIVHRYLNIPEELELTVGHKLARHFILGFRNVGFRDFKDKLQFQNMIPNYRYLDIKLFLFADSVGWTDEKKGFGVADAIRNIKILGIVPFKFLHRVKLTETDKSKMEYSIVKDFKIVRDTRSTLRDFFNLQSVDYEYFANCLVPKVTRDNKDASDREDESLSSNGSVDSSSCVVCLSHEPDTTFLSCSHKACCFDCSEKLEKCPLCRRDIVSRIADWQKEMYERLQFCILRETYSMFEKVVLKS